MGPVHRYEMIYFASRAGCLTTSTDLMGLECTDHKLAHNILDTLRRSRRKHSNKQLHELVYKRARYFLGLGRYDYFSVISLMIFPIKDKEKWLRSFKKIPGKRVPFTKIALEKIKTGKSGYCDKIAKRRKLPFYLREICSLEANRRKI